MNEEKGAGCLGGWEIAGEWGLGRCGKPESVSFLIFLIRASITKRPWTQMTEYE